MTRTVVVIDDEPGYAETVQELLEDEGYTVEIATDGRAGLDVLRRLGGTTCLVLLDLAMPVLDGHAVYRAMKADATLASVSVIIMTSDPSRAPAGAVVLAKPCPFPQLLAAVRANC